LQEFLNHPAVQGGVAPFIVALIVTELLLRARLSGLAIIAGFAVTVYLVSGFAFVPLTASRKIVLLGLLSAGLSLPLILLNPRWLRSLLSVAGGIAVVWVLLRILQYKESNTMLLWGAGCAVYVGWLVYCFDGLHSSSMRAGSAGMALGIGTGLAALFGASALLGQYGLSLGAAAGAYLLIQILTNNQLPCGRSYTLPLSLIAGLTACVAVISAQLPWYVLPVLATIPLVATIPLPARAALWLQSILLSAATLCCASVAVYISWYVAGTPPL